MVWIVKINNALAKLLSDDCRYLDDIYTVKLKYFGDIAKDIYNNTFGPFYEHGLTLIPAWISNYIHFKG